MTHVAHKTTRGESHMLGRFLHSGPGGGLRDEAALAELAQRKRSRGVESTGGYLPFAAAAA